MGVLGVCVYCTHTHTTSERWCLDVNNLYCKQIVQCTHGASICIKHRTHDHRNELEFLISAAFSVFFFASARYMSSKIKKKSAFSWLILLLSVSYMCVFPIRFLHKHTTHIQPMTSNKMSKINAEKLLNFFANLCARVSHDQLNTNWCVIKIFARLSRKST